jgi:hypothetical protein
MAILNINSSNVGNPLYEMLTGDEIIPGSDPSYQLCKTIYTFHPLGKKLADTPIDMAQFKPRIITCPASPEEKVVEAFRREWDKIGADAHIANVMGWSRVYGISSLAMLIDGVDSNTPIDYKKLAQADIGFNVYDPLNTSGSLVLNQNPNDIDFQKVRSISVQGVPYHRSRTVTILNEKPVYIGYTTSAFGYVGRSVYQRPLYPMKSFIQTMITDDLVSLKAGVIIAKMKQPGSVVDQAMAFLAGLKRNLVKEAVTGNVLGITPDEDIETLNMQNVNNAMETSRKNILENIASGADMPAKILNAETFAEGFGEGTEDAKYVARYIDKVRTQMAPLYMFFDQIVMYRAWNMDFYKTIQSLFPKEYGGVEYEQAFYQWKNSFSAMWPSLLTEPESELVKKDDVLLKAIIAVLEVLLPEIDPDNKAVLIQWACDNFNDLKKLFAAPLNLDYQAIAEFVPPEQEALTEPKPQAPFSSKDSARERIGSRQLLRLLESRRDAVLGG